jgi:hypothetical protein
MPDTAAVPIDMDYFDPTINDSTDGAWLDVPDPGYTDMPVDLDTEQDWSRLVL